MSEVAIKNPYEEEDIPEAEGWQIDDDQAAEYAIRKIRDAEYEAKRWAEFYRQQAEKQKAAAERTVEFFTEHLRRYFAKVPHKETKTQESYELPSAKLVWKAQQPEFQHDDNALLEWLKSSDMQNLVKVTEAPDWAKVKASSHVNGEALVNDETGEIVPGVIVIQREPKFTVSMKKEGEFANG